MAYSSTQVLAKLIEEVVPDLRMKKAVTLDYLAAKGSVVKGDHTDLYWNAIVTGSAVATATMATAGSDQTTGDAVQASLGIGAHKIYHQFTVPLVDLVNAQSAGVSKLKNLFMNNITSGLLAIRRQLNTYIWSADGTAASAGIVGLSQVLANTAPYANINPTTYPLWVSVVNTNATARALTRALLYDFSQLLEEQEVYHDALFCTPAMANKYNQLFDAVAGINSVARSVGEGMVDLGYLQRAYNGAMLFTDPQMPTGQLVGLNPNDIKLISLDLAGADQGQMQAMGLKNNLTSISSADVGGLQVNVALLPQSNPGLITFQLFVLPQLQVINRRSVQGLLNLL